MKQRRRRKLNDQEHTAIHEAGHAVIGRVLGMTCGDVTIVADDDSAGHSICEDPWIIWADWETAGKYRSVQSVFRGRILSYMAAAEAEETLLGSCQGGDGDDRYQIDLMFEQLMSEGDDYRAFEGRYRRKTRGLVRRHEASIRRVAAALVARNSLSSSEVDDLISSSSA